MRARDQHRSSTGYSRLCVGFRRRAWVSLGITEVSAARSSSCRPDLTAGATVAKSGYTVTMVAAGAAAATGAFVGAANVGYYATASSSWPEQQPVARLCTDGGYAVFRGYVGAAPTQPFMVAGTVTAIQ